jgi:hypothetical protein
MGSLSSGIKRFLLSAMKSGAEGVAQAGSVTADSCSSAVDCSARDIEYIKLIGGVRNVPASVVEEGTESVDSPLLIPANLDVGCETNQTLATAAGANIRSAAKDEWIEAPEALKEQIACDFFLDTITSDSPLNFCATPIRLVVQQSMETLRLLPSIPCQSRLLKFTQCVESGYQDDKCKPPLSYFPNTYAPISSSSCNFDVLDAHAVDFLGTEEGLMIIVRCISTELFYLQIIARSTARTSFIG